MLALRSLMLILLSPSKTLSFEDAPPAEDSTLPAFLEASEKLMAKLKRLSAKKVEGLMRVNPSIAAQTVEWASSWTLPFSAANARPAAHCFKGAVYTGLQARTWSEADRTFAQRHLRILSGLYGVLKPLDLMQPYRLEMGLKWAITSKTPNLYRFWGDRIQQRIEADAQWPDYQFGQQRIQQSGHRQILSGRVITPAFKELTGNEYKAKMAYAKEARGTMARHIVQHQWTNPEDLKQFTGMGYAYDPSLSSADDWVFTRYASTSK